MVVDWGTAAYDYCSERLEPSRPFAHVDRARPYNVDKDLLDVG
jgi:hypothetical protein